MGWRDWLGLTTGTTGAGTVPDGHPLDALCQQFGATYERAVLPTGEVQLRLIRPDASLTATGATTKDALAQLCQRAVVWEALL